MELPVGVGEGGRTRIALLDQIAQQREAHAAIGAEDRDAPQTI